MAILLDGKTLAEKILRDLKAKVKEEKLKLCLAVVQVGDDKVTQLYLARKRAACQKIGVEFLLFRFPGKITTEQLAKEVKWINEQRNISGIVIQLPLPVQIDTPRVLNLISVEKDIDCLSAAALGKFYQGVSLIMPPVVSAIARLIKEYKISLKGKNIVIVGAGRLVGKPLTIWILNQNSTLSVVDEFTRDIASVTKKADILISGVGQPDLITGEMIKMGSIIFDAGSSFKSGKAVGDIEYRTVFPKASYLTPVPGGIGPLTIACLLENLVRNNS